MNPDDFSTITSDLETNTVQVALDDSLHLVIESIFIHPQIYLSVFVAHNKLGAAFYDSATAIIYFVPDVEETSRFDITQQRKWSWACVTWYKGTSV